MVADQGTESLSAERPGAQDLVHFPIQHLVGSDTVDVEGVGIGDCLGLLSGSGSNHENAHRKVRRRAREKYVPGLVVFVLKLQVLIQLLITVGAAFGHGHRPSTPHEIPSVFAFPG